MISSTSFYILVYVWIAIAILIFPLVLRIVAPYGRHITTSWGPLVNNKAGWIIMEFPALFFFAGFFLFGSNHHNLLPWIFFSFWMIHYVNRTLVFPFRLHTKGKKMPVMIVLMAFCFNLMNGYINGYYLGSLSEQYALSWLYDPRFIAGFLMFSCPNHFSEIIEWSGFALMTWSLPGLAFAIWTLVNLLPRALHHHKWYQATFPDYPANRKALIPYIL